MSSTKSSPRQLPTNQVDESQLPAGHCRYILLLPEVKGQRCGCAHFNLNRSTPGASCECGHLACYHVSNGEPPSLSETQEVAMMKQRLELLEREHVELHQLRRDFMLLQERIGQDHERQQEVVVRVSELEDTVEKNRSEVGHEVREAYRNLNRAWSSITELIRHKDTTENHLRHIDDHLQGVDMEVARIGDRQLELVDVDIALEDRVDNLEVLEDRVEALEIVSGIDVPKEPTTSSQALSHPSHRQSRVNAQPPIIRTQQLPRARSESPGFSLDPTTPRANQPAAFAPALSSALAAAATAAAATTSGTVDYVTQSFQAYSRDQSPNQFKPPIPSAVMALRTSARHYSANTSDLWTVHVSLLPTSTQPFPFERDTNAYKRCLSRGLHQMIAVNGTNADAFEQAIEKAFGRILRGRKWVPLQALPCTADTLAGLPMLRPLDASLIDERCSLDFLRKHCAVCDTNGKIDSLYISMRDRTLSWHSIRRLPVYLEGLEPCWAYDQLLDQNDALADDNNYENDVSSSEDEVMGGTSRPPAGDIVATLPSLKRAASQMSRSSSFGSATAATTPTATSVPATTAAEGEGSRPKVQRIYPLPNIPDVRRSVKTS